MDSIRQKLQGLQAIMITPFNKDLSVDYGGLKHNTQRLVAEGAAWLTPAGNAGEFSKLSESEYRKVIQTVYEAAGGKAVVVPGVTSCSIIVAVELCKFAKDLGCNAAMMAPPFCGLCNYQGARVFFESVMDQTDIPLMFYYYPDHFNTHLTVNEFASLMELKNFVAVKETSNNVVIFTQILRKVKDKVNIISGTGIMAMPIYAIEGAKGYISSLINVMPDVEVYMARTLAEKKYETYRKQRDELGDILDYMTGRPFLSLVKKTAGHFDLAGGFVRPPDIEIDPTEAVEFAAIIKRTKEKILTIK